MLKVHLRWQRENLPMGSWFQEQVPLPYSSLIVTVSSLERGTGDGDRWVLTQFRTLLLMSSCEAMLAWVRMKAKKKGQQWTNLGGILKHDLIKRDEIGGRKGEVEDSSWVLGKIKEKYWRKRRGWKVIWEEGDEFRLHMLSVRWDRFKSFQNRTHHWSHRVINGREGESGEKRNSKSIIMPASLDGRGKKS